MTNFTPPNNEAYMKTRCGCKAERAFSLYLVWLLELNVSSSQGMRAMCDVVCKHAEQKMETEVLN